MIYMLDTDICSYIIRKHTFSVLEKYQEILDENDDNPCISSVTHSELIYGTLLKPSMRPVVEDFLHTMDTLSWDKAAAYQYADVRLYLKTHSLPTGIHDMQIAAHARSIGATIITNNNRHFKNIPGIIVQNWV